MATELYAPMVGKVVSLLVEPGAEVEEDEPVLVLEALKLKVPVVSPVDGTVKEFRVKEGDDVESDTLLAIIEED